MPEDQNPNPAPGSASGPANRWKRWMPLLLVLVGFGAGLLVSQFAPSPRTRHGEHREARERHHDDGDRRRGRRGGERAERTDRDRSRGRESRDRGDRADRGRRYRDQLVRRLGLDEGQQAQLDAFIEANRTEAREFWDGTYARYRELRLRFREQIREILTEAQRETFDEWTRAREQRNGRDPGDVEPSPEAANSEAEPSESPNGGNRP